VSGAPGSDPGARIGGDAEMLRHRLIKNRRHLGKWARREGVTCWRLYDRDIPDVPITVDDYQGALVVADCRRARHDEVLDDAWFAAMVAAVRDATGAAELHEKARRRMADRQATGAQYQRLGEGGAWREVEEGGRRFLVNLSDYLDVGLFLDHRRTRALVAAEAAGKRVLNLFAYTGAFTVHAAAAGAAATVSVDLSNTYLDWAAENLRRNQIDPRHHALERADVLAWLGAYRGARFDLVVVDPPTFSNSKKMRDSFDVLRDHVALLAGVARVAAPGAVVWFSTNHRGFTLDERALPGFARVERTRETVPPDFGYSRPHRSWRFEQGATPASSPGPAPRPPGG
jgi:23S rRNA G2069 N7-methylase RlmK/C1962 C5-methylase RlmI